jgi:hypothetical protein
LEKVDENQVLVLSYFIWPEGITSY